MSIEKTVSIMTGHFSSPFGNKNQYATFSSNGTQHFIFLNEGQTVPVDVEVRGVFECEHKTIVERDKNGEHQPSGVLRPTRFLRKEIDQPAFPKK